MATRRSFSQQQQHMGSFICRRLWFRGCSVHRAMEAWKACAGPLVDVPKIKERVYYFPQGRMEQLEASTNEELNQKITMFNLPSKILCRVLNFQLLRRSPLLIVAEDVESEALTMLIINQHRAGLKVCAVKAPGFGDNRRANLEDLSILTRGEVISKDHGLSLDKVNINMLGSAKKVTVSLDDTIILHGGGDKKLIEERCEQEASRQRFPRENNHFVISNST